MVSKPESQGPQTVQEAQRDGATSHSRTPATATAAAAAAAATRR